MNGSQVGNTFGRVKNAWTTNHPFFWRSFWVSHEHGVANARSWFVILWGHSKPYKNQCSTGQTTGCTLWNIPRLSKIVFRMTIFDILVITIQTLLLVIMSLIILNPYKPPWIYGSNTMNSSIPHTFQATKASTGRLNPQPGPPHGYQPSQLTHLVPPTHPPSRISRNQLVTSGHEASPSRETNDQGYTAPQAYP